MQLGHECCLSQLSIRTTVASLRCDSILVNLNVIWLPLGFHHLQYASAEKFYTTVFVRMIFDGRELRIKPRCRPIDLPYFLPLRWFQRILVAIQWDEILPNPSENVKFDKIIRIL